MAAVPLAISLLGGSFLGVTTHGTAPASFCIKGATPLPDADGWPKNAKPDAWVKVMLGADKATATLFCETTRIDNEPSPMWDKCCPLPMAGSTHARIGGTYFVYVFDGDVSKEEGDFLGETSLNYTTAPGQYPLPLVGGKAAGSAIIDIVIEAQPSPPPPPLAVPPLPPAPPPLVKQICVMKAHGLPVRFDALGSTGGLEELYLKHKGLDETALFYPKPEPWVKVDAIDPADEDFWSTVGDHPGDARMFKNSDHQFGHFEPVYNHHWHVMGNCRSPLLINSVDPKWAWCCDFTGMADGTDYVFQIFDEDAYLGYSKDDFIGFAKLAGDSPPGEYTLDLEAGSFLKGAKGELTVEVITNIPGEAYDNYGKDCWVACVDTGFCEDFCGKLGACCRDGYFGLGCATVGNVCANERHCCEKATALPPPAPPPPTVLNKGEFCLEQGKCKTPGKCKWCGVNGACCKDGDFATNCPASGGGAPMGTYGCVKVAAPIDFVFLSADSAAAPHPLAAHPVVAGLAAASAAGILIAAAVAVKRRAAPTANML